MSRGENRLPAGGAAEAFWQHGWLEGWRYFVGKTENRSALRRMSSPSGSPGSSSTAETLA
jgi:hypothetical protein